MMLQRAAAVPATAATCGACHGEKQVATTCLVVEVALANGRRLPRVRFSPPDAAGRGGRCAGCNVGGGGLHHLGCSLEICPACGREAATCGFRV
jgi:hypothetical protein